MARARPRSYGVSGRVSEPANAKSDHRGLHAVNNPSLFAHQVLTFTAWTLGVFLAVVREQINRIEQTRLERLEKEPAEGSNAMVSLLARVIGVGVETAESSGARGVITQPPGSTRYSALRWAHRLA